MGRCMIRDLEEPPASPPGILVCNPKGRPPKPVQPESRRPFPVQPCWASGSGRVGGFLRKCVVEKLEYTLCYVLLYACFAAPALWVSI